MRGAILPDRSSGDAPTTRHREDDPVAGIRNRGAGGDAGVMIADRLTPAQALEQRGAGGRVTIRDLAEYLELSKGTVSRALNGYSDIAEGTRRRVFEAARRFDYRASSAARAVRTGKCEAVGLVMNVDAERCCLPFVAEFLDGVSRRLAEEGWVLCVSTSFSAEGLLDAHTRLVAENKVDGFILPRMRREDSRVSLLEELNVPFVLFGRTGRKRGLSWYDVQGEFAMEHGVRRLVELGHRRIGYIGARPSSMYQVLQRQGYRDGLEACGIAWDGELERDGAITEPEGCVAARKMLGVDSPPTAILCALDRVALGACRAVRGFGMAPGRDVSVIGFDGIPEGAYAHTPLTTYTYDMRFAGYSVTDLLLRRIGGEAPEALRREVVPTLVERDSDGPLRLTSEEVAARVSGWR